jgi:hypothetical protein
MIAKYTSPIERHYSPAFIKGRWAYMWTLGIKEIRIDKIGIHFHYNVYIPILDEKSHLLGLEEEFISEWGNVSQHTFMKIHDPKTYNESREETVEKWEQIVLNFVPIMDFPVRKDFVGEK